MALVNSHAILCAVSRRQYTTSLSFHNSFVSMSFLGSCCQYLSSQMSYACCASCVEYCISMQDTSFACTPAYNPPHSKLSQACSAFMCTVMPSEGTTGNSLWVTWMICWLASWIKKEGEIRARRPCIVLHRGIVAKGNLLGVKITRSPLGLMWGDHHRTLDSKRRRCAVAPGT